MKLWIGLVVGIAVVAVTALVVLAVAAGGSDSDSDAAPATALPGAPDPEAIEAFRECMSKHGAELPEGPQGGVMVQPGPKTREALEACGSLMPAPPEDQAFGSGTAPAPPGEPGFSPSPQN